MLRLIKVCTIPWGLDKLVLQSTFQLGKAKGRRSLGTYVTSPRVGSRAGKAAPCQEWEEKSWFRGCFQGPDADTNPSCRKGRFLPTAEPLFCPIQSKKTHDSNIPQATALKSLPKYNLKSWVKPLGLIEKRNQSQFSKNFSPYISLRWGLPPPLAWKDL